MPMFWKMSICKYLRKYTHVPTKQVNCAELLSEYNSIIPIG